MSNPFFVVDQRIFTSTCTIKLKAQTIAADVPCTKPYPIGRRNYEAAFHHTPDVAMGSVNQPHMIYLEAPTNTEVKPPMTITVEDTLYSIRAVNNWPAGAPYFLEILTDVV